MVGSWGCIHEEIILHNTNCIVRIKLCKFEHKIQFYSSDDMSLSSENFWKVLLYTRIWSQSLIFLIYYIKYIKYIFIILFHNSSISSKLARKYRKLGNILRDFLVRYLFLQKRRAATEELKILLCIFSWESLTFFAQICKSFIQFR